MNVPMPTKQVNEMSFERHFAPIEAKGINERPSALTRPVVHGPSRSSSRITRGDSRLTGRMAAESAGEFHHRPLGEPSVTPAYVRRAPGARICSKARLDVFALLRAGALTEGTISNWRFDNGHPTIPSTS
jgi:hypothetical protein